MTVAIEEEKKTQRQCVQERTEHLRAKPHATIQSWAVVEGFLSQSFAALEAGNRLRGHVLGLAHLSSVSKIAYTSRILRVDSACGLVETRNTIYRLGEVSEEYDSWCVTAH